MALWNGSWIAAWLVGFVVWGLIVWCVVAYRRRREETGLPAQIRYNLPLEIMYTVIPLIMIAVLFFFTARDEAAIADVSAKPDVVINVVGKQWAWDFNYLQQNGQTLNTYEVGVQGQLTGKPGVEAELPTLYLPVGRRVQFELTSRDVIHSFWIPAFLYKMDVIPGVRNRFQVVPERTGTFKGKCAELCGEYHSEMLFNVQVVTQAQFDAHMQQLKAQGHVGTLDSNLGRSYTPPGPGAVPGGSGFETNGTGSK
jgi:cytochrome c oxidase subunit 2